jgi:uncharacterized membrane protein (DUF2068 family)
VRFVPRSWHNETWVCSMRGHVTPAARAARLRPEDSELGVDTADGRRLSRCLRCDAWVEGVAPPPGGAVYDEIPPLPELDLPRRGKPLSDAIVLRLISLNRAVHCLVFALLATLLLIVNSNLGNLQHWAHTWLSRVTDVADNTTGNDSRDWFARQLQKVASLDKHTIVVLAVTAIGYAVLEGVEAVGLWHEKRWAEYLTVIATVGFLPFEGHELLQRVTVVRITALVVNLAILAYLLYAKRLFGLRGGAKALQEAIDWEEVLRPPAGVTRPASAAGETAAAGAPEAPTPAATIPTPVR